MIYCNYFSLIFMLFSHFCENLNKHFEITDVGSPPFNPLPDKNILDWSKLKQIADDILKCI